MARYTAWALAALLSLPMYARAAEADCEHGQAAPPQQQQQPRAQDAKNGEHKPPTLWWIDPKLRTELGITDQQSAAVDLIWKQSVPKLRERWHRLNDLEKTLSQMIQDAADEPSVSAQIEKVEAARVEGNKERVLMLYRMYKLLSPEQRAKVIAMYPPVDGPRDGRRGGGR